MPVPSRTAWASIRLPWNFSCWHELMVILLIFTCFCCPDRRTGRDSSWSYYPTKCASCRVFKHKTIQIYDEKVFFFVFFSFVLFSPFGEPMMKKFWTRSCDYWWCGMFRSMFYKKFHFFFFFFGCSPISGASMNPVRSLGPAIVANRYQSIWVYMVGPICGAVAGAWAYNLIRFTNRPLREITKSSSFLKSMGRSNSN